MFSSFFAGDAVWFGVPALFGTGLFILKLVLMFAGGHDGDVGVDTGDFGSHDPSASDAAFKLLSIQSLLAFMMGFGWAGLTALSSTKWSMPLVMVAALGGGVAMMYLMGFLMASVFRLQSSGNVHIQSAVGAEGTVYVTVPGENKGQGQVSVVMDDRQRIYTAVTMGEELPRNARVRVVGVHGQSTLSVVGA